MIQLPQVKTKGMVNVKRLTAINVIKSDKLSACVEFTYEGGCKSGEQYISAAELQLLTTMLEVSKRSAVKWEDLELVVELARTVEAVEAAEVG